MYHYIIRWNGNGTITGVKNESSNTKSTRNIVHRNEECISHKISRFDNLKKKRIILYGNDMHICNACNPFETSKLFLSLQLNLQCQTFFRRNFSQGLPSFISFSYHPENISVTINLVFD